METKEELEGRKELDRVKAVIYKALKKHKDWYILDHYKKVADGMKPILSIIKRHEDNNYGLIWAEVMISPYDNIPMIVWNDDKHQIKYRNEDVREMEYRISEVVGRYIDKI